MVVGACACNRYQALLSFPPPSGPGYKANMYIAGSGHLHDCSVLPQLKVRASINGIPKLVKCDHMFTLVLFILIVSSKAKLLQQIQELTTVKNDLTSEVRMLCFPMG